jgi:hypothetical protein
LYLEDNLLILYDLFKIERNIYMFLKLSRPGSHLQVIFFWDIMQNLWPWLDAPGPALNMAEKGASLAEQFSIPRDLISEIGKERIRILS